MGTCKHDGYGNKWQLWGPEERGVQGEGYQRHLGNPLGALGNTREVWGDLSYLPPAFPEHPSTSTIRS